MLLAVTLCPFPFIGIIHIFIQYHFRAVPVSAGKAGDDGSLMADRSILRGVDMSDNISITPVQGKYPPPPVRPFRYAALAYLARRAKAHPSSVTFIGFIVLFIYFNYPLNAPPRKCYYRGAYAICKKHIPVIRASPKTVDVANLYRANWYRSLHILQLCLSSTSMHPIPYPCVPAVIVGANPPMPKTLPPSWLLGLYRPRSTTPELPCRDSVRPPPVRVEIAAFLK